MSKKETHIIKDIASVCGASESSRVYLIVDISDGEAELVVEKTITERYPVQEYEKVMKLHENLNRGGGRRRWSLEDLTK